MTDLNSLVSQPQSASPPQQQGSSGSDLSQLQSLMQPSGGPGPQGAPGAAPGAPQAPDHASTVAAIQHIQAFDKRWKELLADPGIGTKNMRGQIYEVMADMMSDGYVTLPQVMNELKALPTDPLEQKQWLTKHVQNGDKAIAIILQQHANAFPRDGSEPPPDMSQIGKPGTLSPNHGKMMGGVRDYFTAMTPKKPIGSVPMRQGA